MITWAGCDSHWRIWLHLQASKSWHFMSYIYLPLKDYWRFQLTEVVLFIVLAQPSVLFSLKPLPSFSPLKAKIYMNCKNRPKSICCLCMPTTGQTVWRNQVLPNLLHICEVYLDVCQANSIYMHPWYFFFSVDLAFPEIQPGLTYGLGNTYSEWQIIISRASSALLANTPVSAEIHLLWKFRCAAL